MAQITNGFTPASQCIATWGKARVITAVVWHRMQGFTPGALASWNSGAAGAHLCVTMAGEIILACRLEDAAWHAGSDGTPGSPIYGRTPFWRTHNLNPDSVGIEFEGFVGDPFTPEQIAAARRIADYLTATYDIDRAHTFDQIAGHHAHGEISSQRTDPGPTWDWSWVL